MRLGDMEIRHIHSGNFYLDGGAMFGVVPKPLWEKKSPADLIVSAVKRTRSVPVTFSIDAPVSTTFAPALRAQFRKASSNRSRGTL